MHKKLKKIIDPKVPCTLYTNIHVMHSWTTSKQNKFTTCCTSFRDCEMRRSTYFQSLCFFFQKRHSSYSSRFLCVWRIRNAEKKQQQEKSRKEFSYKCYNKIFTRHASCAVREQARRRREKSIQSACLISFYHIGLLLFLLSPSLSFSCSDISRDIWVIMFSSLLESKLFIITRHIFFFSTSEYKHEKPFVVFAFIKFYI